MKRKLSFIAIAVFAIFLGSQITEGVILVPYWKSLSATEFYAYYAVWGPSIGRFYTVLTIVAVLIPIVYAVHSRRVHPEAFRYALLSSLFGVLIIAIFYIYFKSANELFYNAGLDDMALGEELIRWTYWHWSRVIVECLALVFLILSIDKLFKQT